MLEKLRLCIDIPFAIITAFERKCHESICYTYTTSIQARSKGVNDGVVFVECDISYTTLMRRV